MQMELFRRTLAGLLMLVVAVSVGIWVQGRFIDAVRLPTHTRMIGATYTTLSDPFYETINDEIQMQIKSNGDLLLVRDPGQDQERQNQEIEDMLNKGIELLIVNPVDYVGVTPALEKAREKGVPVILIDSKVDDPELVTCTITSNNYGAGLLDARHLISQTKSARIVLLSNSDSFSSWDRLSGFCQTLTKSGNDYRILELRDCGGELNRAMRAMVQLLETFPRIDVVMAVNEQAALGAMAALEEKGVRVSVDDRNEKIGYKIREAQMDKVPYMLVVGEKEAESGTVAVRRRDKGDTGAVSVEEFTAAITKEIADKTAF